MLGVFEVERHCLRSGQAVTRTVNCLEVKGSNDLVRLWHGG
jgi:hypothetical protein